MPADPRSPAARELTPGERLLWTGRAYPPLALLAALPQAAIGLFWTGGMLLSLLGGAPRGFGALWWLFLLAIGLWLLSAPLRHLIRAARTHYALTDRRLLVRIGGRLVTVDRRAIPGVERLPRGGGRASLRIPFGVWRDSDGDRRQDYVWLSGLADAQQVERLLLP
jgi:hypothetical protein